MLVPQLKSRVFEAAFSRSLILCKRDPFNVIENFFEPEEEFVYFDEGELKEKLVDILLNYEKYLPIIENAYVKAVNQYTTEEFFNQYLVNV
jgi:spore maturation protein CgeB